MGCAKAFQLPFNKNEWDVNLTECSDLASDARKVLLDQAIAEAHIHIQTWVDGERVAAQDAAILHLTADHAPPITDLVGDVRVVEWSCCILKAMRYYFMEQHVTEASASLPQSLIDRLDAKRQAKINSAKEDACADAKRLYHAQLQSLQSAALEEAKQDFEDWKTNTLIPEWQAAEANAKADKLAELNAFKHQLAIETEELKENARIIAAKSLIHTHSDRESRKRDRHPKPVGVSRSTLRAHSPSPTPSQKQDKMPTKADYLLVSQTVPLCAPGSDHARGRARPSIAQEVSKSREILTHVEPLAGAEVVKALAGSMTPSCSTSVAALPSTALPVLPILASSDHAVAMAAPMGDAHPSLAEPSVASSTRTVEIPMSDVCLVERYQSVTPSHASPPPPESADDRMMRLLGASIASALAPVQSSIENISSRLRLVEGKQSWAEMVDEDSSMDNLDPSWGAPGDGQDPFPIRSAPVVKAEDDDPYDEVACRDAYEASLTGVGPTRFPESAASTPISNCKAVNPYFEGLTRQAYGIPPTQIDLEGHHATFNRDLVDLWDEFCNCANLHGDDRLVPLLSAHHNVFINLVNNRVQQDRVITALRDSTTPSLAPVSVLCTPSHAPRASLDPISISSDGSKVLGFTEMSPTPTPRCTGVLDLDTPPPGDGHGWTIAGGKGHHSFAQIAAASSRHATDPSPAGPLPPSVAQATHGFLTKPQLESLTKEQVIRAYNAQFSPRLGRTTPKERAVAAFLERASRPAPPAPPAPQPVHKTEYTLVYDSRAGDLSGPSGR